MKVCRAAALAVLLIGIATRAPAEQPGGTIARLEVQAAAATGTVTVFAAASLTQAFQAVANAFEQSHQNVTVQFNFAGSSTLVQQIQEGAPADVFASADEATMQKLGDAGALAAAPRLFARNQLQIVVAAGNPKHIAGLADLTKPGLTVALCGPTVPCGRYAGEAFTKAGVAPPAASQELGVKAVLSRVSMGEADAGIVYITDVRAAAGRVEGVDIPEPSNVVADYPIAVLKHAPNAAAGEAFVEFVVSPEGQRLLASFGFPPR